MRGLFTTLNIFVTIAGIDEDLFCIIAGILGFIIVALPILGVWLIATDKYKAGGIVLMIGCSPCGPIGIVGVYARLRAMNFELV